MDLQATFTLSVAILALAIKPGPGMMAIMSRTLTQGMPACFAFMGQRFVLIAVGLFIGYSALPANDLFAVPH